MRIQIRIRNQYKQWLILSTILYENKDKNIEITSSLNDDKLLPNTDNNESELGETIVEKGFIPYKNISKITIFYYNRLKRPFLFIYLSIIIIGGLLTLISQIGAVIILFLE